MAAVRDADLQANLERYVAETILTPVVDPNYVDWADVRKAVWYLTRIIVSIAPTHIRWWDTPAAMDEAPQEWRAPADTVFAPSDPAPPGKGSAAPKWGQPPWQDLADEALAGTPPGYLTLLDADGFPLPFRARDIGRNADGFDLCLPAGVPWSEGKATLTFRGLQTFVGEAEIDGARGTLRVERALPVFPLTADPAQVIHPEAETRTALMERLEHEAARRGQAIPTVPAEPPEPTAGARYRADHARS